MNKHEWRTITGLSRYRICADGEIITTLHGKQRPMRGSCDRDGYRRFSLYRDDGTIMYVRRACLICEAFHGPRPHGMQVRHLDGTKTNDAASNLVWGTGKENTADKWRHGTQQVGERHGNSKLSECDVIFIRNNRAMGTRTLAELFNVTTACIRSILRFRTWHHVPMFAELPDPAPQLFGDSE